MTQWTTQPGGTFSGADLAARRGPRLLFAGLDFSLASGGALVLSGPNGSGKSTLLRLMALFVRPETGALSWNGHAIGADPDAHRARLHYLGHQDALKPALTVAETWVYWQRLGRPGGTFTPSRPALERVGLRALADLPCRFLSSGQRRRLTLARLLAWPARLWLLDEPGVGLDANGLAILADLLAGHRADGGMVVAATHQDVALDDAGKLVLPCFADEPPMPSADAAW